MDLMLLDVKQVAKSLGVSTKTIQRWRAKKKFPEPTLDDGYKLWWSRRSIAWWLKKLDIETKDAKTRTNRDTR